MTVPDALAVAPHGTRAGYRRGCRCLVCRAAVARAIAQHRRHASPLVPAGEIRAHVAALIARGVGVHQQALLARVSPQTVVHVWRGSRDQIRAATAEKLIAIRPVLAPGQRVSACECWGIMDAILDEGYHQADIARCLGSQTARIYWDRGVAARVRVSTVLKVRALARRLMGEEHG